MREIQNLIYGVMESSGSALHEFDLRALLAPGRPIRVLVIGRIRSRRILRCSIVSR
jgi:hypothetical protein